MMSRGLRLTLLAVDMGMLAYWLLSGLAVLHVVALPAAIMYAGYGTPIIDAWNWSFAPIDILFSLTGLMAVRLAATGDVQWRAWAIISLTLTGCAGLMAISFWALRADFDLGWWLPNLGLLAVALFWLPGLMGQRS